MSFEAFLGVLNNAAFLLALGVLYNTFSDAVFSDSKKNKVIIGVFIAVIGLIIMLSPWDFGKGVFFDTRSILLSVSAFFFGFIPAVIFTIALSALRVFQGGKGAVVGVSVIIMSSLAGLIFRYILNKCSRKVSQVKWYELFLFGIVVHVFMLLLMLLLPEGISQKVLDVVTRPVIVIYPIVTIFLGGLLAKQIKAKELQNLLKNSEARFKKAERIARLGYWAFDFNTGSVIASESARSIYGLEGNDNKIDFVRSCSLPEYKEKLAAEMEGLVKRGESYDVTFKIKRPNDGHIVDIRSVAEFDKESNVVFGVIYDETEKKKLLEQMEKVDKIESLGVLAGGLAHDFNNLLSGIFGNIEMALDEEISSGAKEHLNNAVGIYYRAASLTRQLLTFSKGGAPEKKLGEIEKTLRESVLFALTGTSVKPVFNIEEDLGSIEYDKNQISEVISNIAINAQQSMNGAGEFVVSAQNIEIDDETSIKNGKYVLISLRDSGKGIPHEIIGKVFDPFFSTKERGNGLGLAMCYSIVKKHGGFLTVDSPIDSGAVFKIFLPISDRLKNTQPSRQKVVVRGEGRVLIMDDEDYIRNIVSDMVVAMGYTPMTAVDGKDAIRSVKDSIVNKQKISLILLDLTVPGGMGGVEAVKEIRKIAHDIPVIASSGYSDDPIISNPKEHDFDDSLKKPFLLAGLSDVINRNIVKS